jgi:excisionase family DNA binding protein
MEELNERSAVAAAPHPPYRLLYPVTQAADLLGLKKSLAYDLIARHELEAVRVHGVMRVPHDALLAFIERLRAEAGR